MDREELVRSRLTVAGLDGSAETPGATVRASPALASGESVPPGTSRRELPRISVELRGTLPEPTRAGAPSGPDDRRERDLEVLSTLGEGGMGRVFLARQHSLDRDVAVKTVRDRASDRERAALLSEGAITGALEHPGVVPVHALGVDEDGRPVLVMKRVEGVTWQDLLDDPGHPMWRSRPERERLEEHLEVLAQVAAAAHFAHSRGVVHRDIKPENVFIGRYGEVYLGDWGLAIRPAHAEPSPPLCGTPACMAPEMAVGGRIDPRTDVYLLGATLHRVLTGRSRHDATTVRGAIFSAITSEPVVYPPSVPAALGALANAATSLDPALRPVTAAEFRDRLSGYLRHKGSVALCASARERLAALAALASRAPGAPVREGEEGFDVVAAEARFAIREALDGWPENPEALTLRGELDALLDARRARTAALERMAGELDPTVARGQRTAALAALAVVGVALSVSSFAGDAGAVTTRDLLLQSLAPLGVVLAMAIALRRKLLSTAINRRIVTVTVAAVASLTADRALALLSGAPPAQVLVCDLLLAGVLSVVSAAATFRWMGVVAAPLLAAALWAAVYPAAALHAFSLGTGAALLAVVGFTWRG